MDFRHVGGQDSSTDEPRLGHEPPLAPLTLTIPPCPLSPFLSPSLPLPLFFSPSLCRSAALLSELILYHLADGPSPRLGASLRAKAAPVHQSNAR